MSGRGLGTLPLLALFTSQFLAFLPAAMYLCGTRTGKRCLCPKGFPRCPLLLEGRDDNGQDIQRERQVGAMPEVSGQRPVPHHSHMVGTCPAPAHTVSCGP